VEFPLSLPANKAGNNRAATCIESRELNFRSGLRD
jgi:hypothetical protein